MAGSRELVGCYANEGPACSMCNGWNKGVGPEKMADDLTKYELSPEGKLVSRNGGKEYASCDPITAQLREALRNRKETAEGKRVLLLGKVDWGMGSKELIQEMIDEGYEVAMSAGLRYELPAEELERFDAVVAFDHAIDDYMALYQLAEPRLLLVSHTNGTGDDYHRRVIQMLEGSRMAPMMVVDRVRQNGVGVVMAALGELMQM